LKKSRFSFFPGFLDGGNLGTQAVRAEASFRIGGRRNFWQFCAPAAAFRQAGHCGAALCAFSFHRAMMAQLRRGVQRCWF